MMLVIGNGKLFTRNDEMPFVENGAVAIEDKDRCCGGNRGYKETVWGCRIH